MLAEYQGKESDKYFIPPISPQILQYIFVGEGLSAEKRFED